jgi:hypothetical protein
MDDAFWQKLAQAVSATERDEIGCEECFAELDRFVELVREGRPAEDVMPRVQAHLERCGDCREEYEALLEALEAIE